MFNNIIDIARVGGREPTGSGPEYKIACPYPERHQHGDAKPSCSLNTDKGVWYCHSCEAGGGARDLAEALGVSMPGQRLQPTEMSAAMRRQAEALHARSVFGLFAGQPGQDFLEARSLTVEAAEEVGVGYVEVAGDDDIDGIPAGSWMTFTYFDTHGPALVKLRPLTEKTFRRMPTGAPSLLFNLQNLDPSNLVIVTEGELDTTALATVGIRNVVSVPGGSGTKVDAQLLAPLAGTPVVLIATDQDGPGEALAQKLAKGLGYDRCKRVRFGRHKDANDALIAGATSTDFERWLTEADEMTDTSWPQPVDLPLASRTPFPVDSLPSPMCEMVKAVSTSKQTPLDLAAIMAMGVVSAACAGKATIWAKNDHHEPLNLFVAGFMDPANRKSAVSDAFTAVIDDHAERVNVARRSAQSTQKARRSALQGQLKEAEKEVGAAKSPEERERAVKVMEQVQVTLDALRPVADFRPYTSDCTPEKLAAMLYDQNGILAVFDTEGSFINNVGGRYSAKSQPNIEVVLKAHSGDTVTVDRQGGTSYTIPSPALTVAMVVQPDVLSQMGKTSAFCTRGLNARILYSLPYSLIGRRDVDAPGVPEETKAAYQRTMTRLLEIDVPVNAAGRRSPHEMRLDQDARAAYLELARNNESRLGADGDLHEISGWAGKHLGAVVRIAGLLHMVKHAEAAAPWQTPVTAETFAAARKIGDYFIDHAKIAFGRMRAETSMESAEYLLATIKRRSMRTFSSRELFQVTKSKFRTMADIEPVIDALEDQGFVRKPHADGQPRKPGRPASATYEVNPRWLAPDGTVTASTEASDARVQPRPAVVIVEHGPATFDAAELLRDAAYKEYP